jgi:uncharacterized protein (TIGR00255 family)
MTGFARADGETEAARWHWELRCVNGKGLDARFRLVAGFETMEAKLREELARHMKRGNVQISLTMERARAAAPLRVNEDALNVILTALADLQQRVEFMPPSKPRSSPPSERPPPPWRRRGARKAESLKPSCALRLTRSSG